MSKPVESYKDRLAAAADYVRDCHNLWKAALEARDEIVMESLDAGYPTHRAARDTRLTQPHIIRIASQSQPGVTLAR